MPYAAEKEIFILGATGAVSFVDLLNLPDAPLAKTSFHGNFHITSFEGNIVFPKRNEKNKASRVTVLLADDGGRIRGGPVRTLIAKSSVQVFIATTSPSAIESIARRADSAANELPPIMDIYKNRLAEVVNKVHKTTLDELNP
ncbi:PPC domain [Sesbania bispinosa]|nr:PPC domain [Sesbania bispinosa]